MSKNFKLAISQNTKMFVTPVCNPSDECIQTEKQQWKSEGSSLCYMLKCKRPFTDATDEWRFVMSLNDGYIPG